ncbi:MAG: AMP-binding protein, partial [Bdellovibrionota bacterium]
GLDPDMLDRARDIPYLDQIGALQFGAFVTKMVFIDQSRVQQEDHQVFFAGSIPHELDGTAIVDLSRTLIEIENTVSARYADSAGKSVLLKDADPLRFALTFFTLIDLGVIPVPVSHETPDSQFESLTERIQGWKTGVYASLTSGTTSAPKLCAFSLEGALANAQAHATSLELTSTNKIIQALPLYHSYGIVCYLWTSVAIGCAIDFQTKSPSIATLSLKSPEYVVYLSPAQARFFTKFKSKSTPKLSIVSVGGGGLSGQEAGAFIELFKESKCYVTYGLTEAGPRVSTGRMRSDFTSGAYIGRALPGVEVSISNQRLCVKSPSLKLNLDPIELAAPGVLLTRDHVKIDNGDIYFLSRESDLINVGGVSIYPGDIEAVARRCDGVNDCIVLKVRDSIYEETPVLIAEGTATVENLLSHLTTTLSPGQMPKQIFVVDQMPRQSLNKIDRITLAKKLGLDGN